MSNQAPKSSRAAVWSQVAPRGVGALSCSSGGGGAGGSYLAASSAAPGAARDYTCECHNIRSPLTRFYFSSWSN